MSRDCPCSACPCSAGPCSACPCSTGPCSACPCSTGPCSACPCSAGPCSAGPCSAGPCSACPCSAGPCSVGAVIQNEAGAAAAAQIHTYLQEGAAGDRSTKDILKLKMTPVKREPSCVHPCVRAHVCMNVCGCLYLWKLISVDYL